MVFLQIHYRIFGTEKIAVKNATFRKGSHATFRSCSCFSREHQMQVTRSGSRTFEALRGYHQAGSSDNNSDRDSRSTSSQSHCGHHSATNRRSSVDSSKKHQQRIAYISSNENHMNLTLPIDYHHQVRL